MVQKNSVDFYNCIIVLGPTASGKSEIALKLAKRYNGNIINCDSQQIYKGISIGTAKPTSDEFAEVQHHLFDYVALGDEYSVSKYYSDAEAIFKQLIEKKILPIFVGGTGLYIDSLLYEHDYGYANKDNSIREKYIALSKEKGNEYIYNLLKDIDPLSAEKLHPNDVKRVVRALEIAKTGKLKSSQNLKPNSLIRPYIIHVDMEREMLYERINLRVDKMIKNGLENEVEDLYKKGYYATEIKFPIGYSEWKDYYASKLSYTQTIDLIKQHSRNYAKRQKTWFRRVNSTIEYNPLHNTMQDLYDILDKYFIK